MNGQVSKPDHIFDRDREWKTLVRFATSESGDVRLGIVSGRRRQGKTYLLDAAATTFGGFFFAATDSTETESLASFGRALAGYGGGRYAFADWDEALQRLFGVVSDGPYLAGTCAFCGCDAGRMCKRWLWRRWNHHNNDHINRARHGHDGQCERFCVRQQPVPDQKFR